MIAKPTRTSPQKRQSSDYSAKTAIPTATTTPALTPNLPAAPVNGGAETFGATEPVADALALALELRLAGELDEG